MELTFAICCQSVVLINFNSRNQGSRTHELTNHLGNVLSTISDKKVGHDSSGAVDYYTAEVLSQNDYYPFGMLMQGRGGHVSNNGGWSSSGESTIPQSLSLSSRTGNEPMEYVATEQIEFVPGFESGNNDEFTAYITTDNGSGGSGGSGSNSGSEGNGGYRYGFNGKENDNEVKGEGNQQDYGARIYDPRLGRFLSVDPLTKSYPWYTPYQFAGNMPLWAIDLDGGEEKKTTDFKPQDIISYSFNKVFVEEQIKNMIADQLYAALDKQIPSKAERVTASADLTKSPRYKGESDVIKAEIKNYIVVDLENKYSAVYNPDSKEPELIYKIGRSLFDFAYGEAQPYMAKASGTATYNVGKTIVKVSENIESYKTKFYQKFFPNKYESASKINTGLNKFIGKTLKGTGTLLKVGAKTLDLVGTIGMAYEIINPNHGALSDDQLREFTKNALQQYLSRHNNITQPPTESSNSSTRNLTKEKKTN